MDAGSEQGGRPTGRPTGSAPTRRHRLLVKAYETPWPMTAFAVAVAVLGVLRFREGRWQLGLMLLTASLLGMLSAWWLHADRARKR